MIKVKVGNFPIYISPDILIPIVIFSVLGELRAFIYALVFSFLHELSHLAMAKALKYSPQHISVNMFGEVLYLKNEKILPEHEIIINLSGPVFNLLTGLLLLILYTEGIKVYTDLILINAVLGLYNLMPFYPLDGGKTVFVYLKAFMEEEAARRLIFGFAKVFLFFNFFLGLYLVQYNLLNCLICILAINIFISIVKEERINLFGVNLRTKIEQESKKYV